ncbi:hypothetical protein Lal_00021706 [Lupinus albus]|nr:hypothetical protein Lal_00021706 [Lupinus albus]
MRLRFVIWFLFLSYTHAISISGLHTNLTLEQKHLNISKSSNMQTQQSFEKRIKEAIKLQKKDEENNIEEKHELSCDTITKSQRGKGASRGVNANHQPRRSTNSATPLLSWISTVCIITITLILVFSFNVRVL